MRLERFIGPLPGHREARAFGVCGIGAALLACGLSLYFGFRNEAFLGRPLGGDFVQFYAAARLLNQHEPTKIFDGPYFSAVQHEILPTMPATQWLIFGNPPCIPALFRPLALLPYKAAYCVWLAMSAGLYLAGLMILLNGRWDATRRRTAYLLALSTPMFTLETWVGGQVSIFGFFLFAVCVKCFEREKYFLAGLALGLTAYKPSLLVIPAVMFLAGRFWRLLAGAAIGASVVVTACFAAAGVEGMRLWLLTLKVFQYMATEDQSILRRTKYVDLNSFLVVLFGLNAVTKVVAFVIVAAALLVLAWMWFRSRSASMLLWAGTIAAMLVLNVYVPVYDTIVLIPALLLVASNLTSEKRSREFQIWMLLFAVIPWLTQSAADFARLQLITIVIAGFSFWTLQQPNVLTLRRR